MKKTIYKYLYKLPLCTYNNEKPYYNIDSLPRSNILREIIFCGLKGKLDDGSQGITYVYFELSKKLDGKNSFLNLIRPLNLIWFATGQPVEYEEIKVERGDDFNKLYKKHKATQYYKKGTSYGGLVNDKNPIKRVVSYSHYLNVIDQGSQQKFENALNTYCYAKELERLPNPHYRYTLFMTLYLVAIDQLAENPIDCENNKKIICPVCKRNFVKHSKKGTGPTEAIKRLLEEYIPQKTLKFHKRLVLGLFRDIRHNYLHDGSLMGSEENGGFLFNEGKMQELVENMANIAVLTRSLIEQFLQKQATGIIKANTHEKQIILRTPRDK